MKMNEKQMLEYIEQFHDKSYDTEREADADLGKIVALAEKFGYKVSRYVIGFELHNKKSGNSFTIWTRLDYGKTNKYKGVLIVRENDESNINPNTGKPWKIGDVHQVSPYYSVTLTSRGWYSGD